jgi:RAD3-like DEAD/DEAH box helicase
VVRGAQRTGGPGALPLGELKGRIMRVTAGRKIAYVIDCAFTEENVSKIVALANGADLLFIEGGFLQADAAEAARRRHLTASQAGTIARLAGVKRLQTCTTRHARTRATGLRRRPMPLFPAPRNIGCDPLFNPQIILGDAGPFESAGAAPSPPTRSSRARRMRTKATNLLGECRRTARQTFGIARLRPQQEAAMVAVLEGHDALAMLPTGSGKSLIYQVPAMILERPTIVISPLIALMADQERALRSRGLPVVAFHSRLRAAERRSALERLEGGGRLIVLTTPETLESPATAPHLEHARPECCCFTPIASFSAGACRRGDPVI